MKVVNENQVGNLSIENIPEVMPKISDGKMVDVELLTAKDGRIWINVNGISFIRFRPMKDEYLDGVMKHKTPDWLLKRSLHRL